MDPLGKGLRENLEVCWGSKQSSCCSVTARETNPPFVPLSLSTQGFGFRAGFVQLGLPDSGSVSNFRLYGKVHAWSHPALLLQNPKGPCTQIVYTLASKHSLYRYVGPKVHTIWVHGPLGEACRPGKFATLQSQAVGFVPREPSIP